MKEKFAKVISILTVVPIVAFLTVTLLYLNFKDQFTDIIWYLYSILFLTIIPIMAYPLKHVIPKFKNTGRKGERKLAFILAVVSYLLGAALTFILKAPLIVQKIFAAYVTSGGVLAFVNKVLRVRASGHACGVSGPMTLLYHFIGGPALLLFLILPIVFWARISLKRHTYKELFLGTAVGILSTFLSFTFL